jgi:hypothetical protein
MSIHLKCMYREKWKKRKKYSEYVIIEKSIKLKDCLEKQN